MMWVFGNARYGERMAIVEAEDWDGPAYQTCFNAANVAQKFELNRRRLSLSFKHHAEVASLPADEADALLDWAQGRIHHPPTFARNTPEILVFGRRDWLIPALLPTLSRRNRPFFGDRRSP